MLYVATFAEAVYVFHAFEKRTRKTAIHDVELARQRSEPWLVSAAQEA